MTQEEYQKAQKYWMQKDAKAKKMPEDQLKAAVLDFIRVHNTCALATGSGDVVRCTPIEYTWHDDAFWMFSEGGQKFVSLEKNKKVCLAIYDPYNGFGTLKGMQVSGAAQLPEPFSEEYLQAADFKKIPREALKKLDHPLYLIRICPDTIEFLNSDFKKAGYDSRQKLEIRKK